MMCFKRPDTIAKVELDLSFLIGPRPGTCNEWAPAYFEGAFFPYSPPWLYVPPPSQNPKPSLGGGYGNKALLRRAVASAGHGCI